ncbi:flagellar biosynthesis repressor FlbT [Yangia mangrovi]|uniref:Flagellar biosynthesis repressor FlbT n=1 Tax=Alloyangia mangrovi TaxID=1779329 RepID=A0A2A3JSH6_9RHOB|nr:flagellar biosynthesis repressor FlbT [Alloyangia mangrovi]MCA0942305.1 flagellar biosynthesis repressor FlbT [Alloyangia pacifica]MCA0947420.1 flagellar biosynthesis repressor FlbT [Alloyangia pacifica]MCT4369499.1 flagellar biosynthesis repressor FlbT [Alloyangia mangrovi]
MALNLTLKPFERIVVNGCMMRNGGRKTTLTIENRADIIRETDLLKPEAAATPVRAAYFLIQSALIYPERRDPLTKSAQQQLAKLATVFSSELVGHVFEAANNVSMGEYFTALRELRPLMKRELEVLGPAGLDPVSPDDLPRIPT